LNFRSSVFQTQIIIQAEA